MKCPHCGQPMEEEQVFCEHCGKERFLVPVFEPELELEVTESLTEIVKELAPETVAEDATTDASLDAENDPATDDLDSTWDEDMEEDEDSFKTHSGTTSHLGFLFGAIITVLVLIAAFSIGFWLYTIDTFEYKFNKAQTAYNISDYQEALTYVNECLAMESDNYEAKLLKLYIYQSLGDEEYVIAKCLEFMEAYPTNSLFYEMLIPIYIEHEEYTKLNQLLLNCEIESITTTYGAYAAFAPTLDLESGTYASGTTLKIITNGNGDVFYTTDGTTPSRYSNRYTSPISLSPGEYEIQAIYINDYDLVSEVTTRYYVIESASANSLVVTPESGNYDMPQRITVTMTDDVETVYYTTDGSTPTTSSSVYTKPLYMPEGESVFKFITEDAEGNLSEVATYSYACNPESNFTEEQALAILKQYLVSIGEIADTDGSVLESSEKKTYSCGGLVTLSDQVYYVFYEYVGEENETPIRSGKLYGFAVINGAVGVISADSDANLTINIY